MPAPGTAWYSSRYRWQFGPTTATRSPAPSPSSCSPPTNRRHRSHVSSYVSSTSPQLTAVAPAAIRRALRNGPSIVVMFPPPSSPPVRGNCDDDSPAVTPRIGRPTGIRGGRTCTPSMLTSTPN